MAKPVRVKNLYVYPVKSAAGISLSGVELDELGLAYDRRWMVVDDEYRFITQRQEARLAGIKPQLSKQSLILTASTSTPLKLSLTSHEPTDAGSVLTGQVWNRLHPVLHCGPEATDWVSDYLGYRAHIVRLCEHTGLGSSRSFADSSPVLIISAESLEDLNKRLSVPVDMNRFRPNIVLQGCRLPYQEDAWGLIQVGDVKLQNAKPCTRCVIITIDQDTLVKNAEPLAALAAYRKHGSAVAFGRYYAIAGPAGRTIRVGDVVCEESSR